MKFSAYLKEADTLTKVDDKNYTVKSTSGNTYNLKINAAGNVRCSCPASKFRGKCRHTELVPKLALKARVSREIADEAVRILKPGFLNQMEAYHITGSYRRGKSTIGDIDILCIGNSFPPLVETDEDLTIEMKGVSIIRGKIKTKAGMVKYDLLRVPKSSEGPALLYRTGPKELNMKMRAIAKHRGWKLSEHGLFDETGKRIDNNTEADIFNKLDMKYQTPEERG